MRYISTIFTWLGIFTLCQAQNPAFQQPNNCGVEPARSLQELQLEAKAFQQWQAGQTEKSVAPIRTIPVVFHLIETNPSITDEEVRIALASLNNAFSHSHNYPEGKDYSIAGVGVDTEIEFCLAQRTPDGGVTNGITRITSNYEEFDMDLENAELKTHAQWDPRYYLNIWVTSRINSEIFALYSGRNWWNRAEAGGYATLPAGVISGDHLNDGIVVAGLRPNTLAHEAGHYLGLLHTFGSAGGGGCTNNDCLVNGDRVCDTPPDNFVGDAQSCDLPDNSCDTDTLSNYSNGFFPNDVPDMITNFMDYGNASCHYDFTNGQKERMHFHLDSYRIELFTEAPSNNDACISPCDAELELAFTRDSLYPLPNEVIQFSSTSLGVDTYEWYVEPLGDNADNYSVAWLRDYMPDSTSVGNGANLAYTFPEAGKYRVYLKAWHSSDPSCHISYMSIVKVTCGVDARFWPDKRLIASKQPAAKMLDSVFFTNRSVGASEYEWIVTHYPRSNQTPAQPELVTNSYHLSHTFLEPGDYHITLIASDGMSCQDTLGPFILPVDDPTIDGIPVIDHLACFQEDQVRMVLRMYNRGYDTIPAGAPVSFYDADPRQTAGPPNLIYTYNLTRRVFGHDTYEDFYLTIPLDDPDLNQLYAVFNDAGSTSFPISFPTPDLNVMSINSEFPPTGMNELHYSNNVNGQTGFQFSINIEPPAAIVCEDSEVQLAAEVLNGPANQYTWTANASLSCTDCPNPTLSVGENDIELQVIATSSFACMDTATLTFPVTAYEDPSLTDPPDICQDVGTLNLADYAIGNDLSWYESENGGTASSTAPPIENSTPGTFTVWVSENANGCESARFPLNYTVRTTPPPPEVLDIPDRCVGSDPPDLINFVNGTNLLWYTSPTDGPGVEQPPLTASDEAGVFIYWVSQTFGMCEGNRRPIAYTVREMPSAPSVNSIPDLCVGAETIDLLDYVTGENLRWYDSEDGNASSNNAPQISTSVEREYRYWVSQTTDNCEGPRSVVEVRVISQADIPEVEPIPDRCAGTSAPSLADFVNGTNLLWYDDAVNGTGSPGAPQASTAVGGTYTHWVSQSVAGCESERAALSYYIEEYPEAPLVADVPDLCLDGETIQLEDFVSGSNLLWYETADALAGSATPPLVETTQARNYSFWVSQTVGACESERTQISFAVIELALETDGPYVVTEGDFIDLRASVFIEPTSESYDLQWLDVGGFVVGDASTLTVSPPDPTFYTVRVTAGSCIQEEVVAVDVKYILRPARIFSPNGDGSNDLWQINRIERFPEAEISIYNRWGALVFHQLGAYNNTWDGSWKNGEPLPIATYYYVIDAYGDGREMVTGSVTIMR